MERGNGDYLSGAGSLTVWLCLVLDLLRFAFNLLHAFTLIVTWKHSLRIGFVIRVVYFCKMIIGIE